MNTQILQALLVVVAFAVVAQAAMDCNAFYNECVGGGGGTQWCGVEEQLCESGQY